MAQLFCFEKHRLLLLIALSAMPALALAQDNPLYLPPITIDATAEPGSLTVPTADEARRQIEQTPGAVEVVSDEAWRDTPASTIKDMLDYTPGVFAQSKWGEDTRLSIRGSGLSRNYHMRGIQLYQDGVPFNAADGSTDFQEIDPTAYRYTEVYKGANALRYGASTLGGAINFVTPTGYDAHRFQGRDDIGSFGFRRLQASTGGVHGDVDGFITGSWLKQDGFRDHSGGESHRASGNLGWRISDNVETRFYINAAHIRQDIPGTVEKHAALSDPRTAAGFNLLKNFQRDIDSVRLANKTTLQFDEATIEFGAYASDKHVIHPIHEYLDYRYHDFGGFGRFSNDWNVSGHDSRYTLGINVSGGRLDNRQYVNDAGRKDGILSKSKDTAVTTVVYAENIADLNAGFSLVTGLQYVHTTRKRRDALPTPPDSSGKTHHNFLNPKLGLIWQADPDWQVFGNISRSGEAPTFSELSFTNAALSDLKAQQATTVEIGTRGEKNDFNWDLAIYRAQLRHEFQFFDLNGRPQVMNADRTIHQGLEAGIGWAFWKGLFRGGKNPDRLWLNAAYTFSDFRFDDDPLWGNNTLPGAPRHYLRAELLYKHPHGFYAGPNVEWVPQAYYVDNANRLDTEAYALLGLRAGHNFNDHVSVYLDARNLTDRNYIASASVTNDTAVDATNLFEPGSGRAFYAGLQLYW